MLLQTLSLTLPCVEFFFVLHIFHPSTFHGYAAIQILNEALQVLNHPRVPVLEQRCYTAYPNFIMPRVAGLMHLIERGRSDIRPVIKLARL